MRISVTIPAIRTGTVSEAIDSIRRQTHGDWELIVVGQGPDLGLRQLGEAASKSDTRIRYIHLEKCGTCRARNAGIRAATGEILAFIDDDCVAREDWLETMAGCFEREPEVEVVGGALLKPSLKGLHIFAACPAVEPTDSLYDPVASGRKPPEGFGWIGCNFGMRRSVVDKIGMFDESLGPGTDFPCAEDTDYLLRLEASGTKMRSTPKVVVVHENGYRFGLRSVLRNSRNYAWGNGGMAAKLKLQGDPRGDGWLKFNRRDCLVGWVYPPKPHRLPANLLRLWNFTRSFEYCLRHYDVDSDGRALVKKHN